MSETLQDRGVEEFAGEDTAADVPVSPQTTAQSPASHPTQSWLRFAYCTEYLVSLIAVFVVWTQVGGQAHLDLLPWYIKLICAIAMSWCMVRFTAGMVEFERAWNHKTRAWLLLLILVGVIMGGITYYYHLHEAVDEPDSDETARVAIGSPGAFLKLT